MIVYQLQKEKLEPSYRNWQKRKTASPPLYAKIEVLELSPQIR